MDLATLMQQAGPGALAGAGGEMAPPPMMGDPAAMGPLMGAPDPMGMGMGAPVGPAFPSTDPNALAQIVAECLANAQMQDSQMLEMQQQQAEMAAQPIIAQMLASAAPQPVMADPMPAFGVQEGLPPLPPEGMLG